MNAVLEISLGKVAFCFLKGKHLTIQLNNSTGLLGVNYINCSLANSLVAQSVKNLPAVQETQVWSLGWEDPLEKEMATHSSILAWKISWTEEPGGLQSMGRQESGTTERLTQHIVMLNPCKPKNQKLVSLFGINQSWLCKYSPNQMYLYYTTTDSVVQNWTHWTCDSE